MSPLVRFSRIITLPAAVALGASISVGLGVIGLLGNLISWSGQQGLVSVYLLATIAVLPIMLTYAERISVISGSGGAYNLARRSNWLGQTFLTGWIMLGGHLALLGLLGWSAALHFNLFLHDFFDYSGDLTQLAVVVIGLAALNNLLEKSWSWQFKTRVVFVGLGFILYLLVQALLTPSSGSTSSPWRQSSTGAETFQMAAYVMSAMWGLQFILNLRDEIKRPNPTLFQSILLSVMATCGLGVLAGLAVSQHVSQHVSYVNTLMPLLEIADNLNPDIRPISVILYAIFGLLISLIALNHTFAGLLQVVSSMSQDGFLPPGLLQITKKYNTPILALMPLTLVAIAMLVVVSIEIITGLAATTFLWTASLVFISDALRREVGLPDNRFPRLPFHPLFPWLSVAVGVIMPLTMPLNTLLLAVGWAAIGGMLYVAYARRPGLQTRQRESVVTQDAGREAAPAASYTVMIGLSNPHRQQALIEAGARLAQARQGRLLLLKILTAADHIPSHIRHQTALQERDLLTDVVQQLQIDAVPVTVLVRIAADVTGGMLEAVNDERADLLLLGWPHASLESNFTSGLNLARVVGSIACEVALFRGQLSASIEQILVAVADSPNAPAALALSADLSAISGAPVTATHFLPDDSPPEQELAAQQFLQSITSPQNGHNDQPVRVRLVKTRNVLDAILRQSRAADVLLLGASWDEFLEKSYLGPIPTTVADQTATPTIITKAARLVRRNRWLKLWDTFSSILPTLTQTRQTEVLQNMRDAALPTVDFFVLITLAATIAMLGLLQNSAAVIIGAMLVAPLMSPILAMAMAMVNGDLRMLVTAAESTTKGIVLAIVVGTLFTLLSPLKAATPEILARTTPNLLDLLVALASGAAAGYALGRKEVAAALPGVAIAAALVPPLCVVGYGIGTSQLLLGGGALLLFTTNLIAIVLAAALVFLALGFHPAPSERGELFRGLKVTLVSLGAVTLILALSTAATLINLNRNLRVEQVFQSEVLKLSAEVVNSDVTNRRGTFLINATIISYAGASLTPAQLEQLRRALEDAVGGPVQVSITALPGYRTELEGLELRRQLQILFTDSIAELGGQVSNISVVETRDGLALTGLVIFAPDNPITEADLAQIQESLTAETGVPVAINATLIAGRQISIDAPSPTPTPGP